MSRREKEQGTLKFPSAAWSPFKKALQEAVTRMYEQDYALALVFYDAVAALKKGKRGVDLNELIRAEFYAQKAGASRYASDRENQKYQFHIISTWELKKAMLSEDKKSLLKPKKKDFTFPNSKTLAFSQGPLSIRLDNEKRELVWDVDEGNHNVTEAHEAGVGKACLRLLKDVKWTRATGGVFVMNDEYNEEAGEGREGGGGNYVSMRFGPLGEPDPRIFGRPSKKGASSTARPSRLRSY